VPAAVGVNGPELAVGGAPLIDWAGEVKAAAPAQLALSGP
jgi:hypothetical protein